MYDVSDDGKQMVGILERGRYGLPNEYAALIRRQRRARQARGWHNGFTMNTRRVSLFLSTAALLSFGAGAVRAADFPDPAIDVKASSGPQTAVLAGGCFWCTEAVYEIIEGVSDVISGYTGDTKETAKYDIVSTGRTKHAEAVLITHDPKVMSYGQLLKIFFSVAHDPTTLNRQGPDVGSQYRSAIFYTNDEQKRVAEAYIKQLNEAKVFSSPIVTQVAPLEKFYTAEGYHQNYASLNRANPYIVNVSDPKVEKLKKLYPGCVRRKK
jgi:peptide-methionine (S)-S-oxide reductase